ncbi:MAG: hypothetical protein M3Z33_06005 [Actinomycetota bacterium]|nr:hypothetical protein [Actinomycetota bacterium]
MDRDSLERFVSLGLSLEQIGARVNRDPSTVGYWVKKYGLTAVHRQRNAPRGGLERERLEAMVHDGASHRALAEAFEVSTATVRYWLKRFGLQTDASRRRGETRSARRTGQATLQRHCSHHGWTEYFLEGRGSYRCCLCGYDRHVGALQFHHVDPDGKGFGLAERGLARAISKCRQEAAKCVLLCANCHAEVEAGIRKLSLELTTPPSAVHTEG